MDIVKLPSLLLFICIHHQVSAQKQVSITIDDLPMPRMGKSVLLEKIDSLQLPTAIFINENKLTQDNGFDFNYAVLESWVSNPLITLGNHSFSHARYSTIGLEAYKKEVTDGEIYTKALAQKHGKELKHFRFPYNDLGRDSLQQDSIKQFLASNGYRISPFTIESSDWMFNAVYKKHLNQDKLTDAKEIANLYINYTLQLFDFYDSVGVAQYGRQVKQIYLCHDNELNRDYLDVLVDQLRRKEYTFISFDDALTDPIYDHPSYFHKKYGISWFYRWIENVNERNALGRAEPTCNKIETLYEALK